MIKLLLWSKVNLAKFCVTDSSNTPLPTNKISYCCWSNTNLHIYHSTTIYVEYETIKSNLFQIPFILHVPYLHFPLFDMNTWHGTHQLLNTFSSCISYSESYYNHRLTMNKIGIPLCLICDWLPNRPIYYWLPMLRCG